MRLQNVCALELLFLCETSLKEWGAEEHGNYVFLLVVADLLLVVAEVYSRMVTVHESVWIMRMKEMSFLIVIVWASQGS